MSTPKQIKSLLFFPVTRSTMERRKPERCHPPRNPKQHDPVGGIMRCDSIIITRVSPFSSKQFPTFVKAHGLPVPDEVCFG